MKDKLISGGIQMRDYKKACPIKNFFCGIFLGMATGWFLFCCMQNPKKIKRKAKKCTNAMEDLLDNVHYMFK